MPTCALTIAADTGQVRVARMVACAAARRVGMPEDEVDDVRLAVGEAVGRAVLRHQRHEQGEPVRVQMTDEPGSFAVEVLDRAGSPADDDSRMAMAVITGLVPDAEVRTAPDGGQILRMVWAR